MVQREHIERAEVRRTATEQQRGEVRTTVGIQTNDFTIEDRRLTPKDGDASISPTPLSHPIGDAAAMDLKDTPRDDTQVDGAKVAPSLELPGPAAVPVASLAFTIVAVAITIALLRYKADVFIPFVLAGLIFYALDPMVDRLQRWRVPRAAGPALAIILLVVSVGTAAYTLADDVTRVAAEVPAAARKLRATSACLRCLCKMALKCLLQPRSSTTSQHGLSASSWCPIGCSSSTLSQNVFSTTMTLVNAGCSTSGPRHYRRDLLAAGVTAHDVLVNRQLVRAATHLLRR